MDTNSQPAAQDDGAEFVATHAVVRFGGQDLTLRPLNVQQAIQLSRSLRAVLPALDRMQSLLSRPDAVLADAGAEEIALLIDLLADYGDPLIDGIAIAASLPADVVRGSDDFAGLFGLVAAIVRVNADFFARQVGPYLAGLPSAGPSGDGPTPSRPLSPPGTH